MVDPVSVPLLHDFGKICLLLARLRIGTLCRQFLLFALYLDLESLFVLLIDYGSFLSEQFSCSLQPHCALLQVFAFKIEQTERVLLP